MSIFDVFWKVVKTSGASKGVVPFLEFGSSLVVILAVDSFDVSRA